MILEKCTFFSPALYSLLTHQSPGLLVNMNFPVFAVLMSHIQDPLSPKVQIFQTIKSRRGVKRPRAALKYPRGVCKGKCVGTSNAVRHRATTPVK